MKITISKNQWKTAGVKAGWLNTTKLNVTSTYVDPQEEEPIHQEIPDQEILDNKETFITDIIEHPRNYSEIPTFLKNPETMAKIKEAWLRELNAHPLRGTDDVYENLPTEFQKDLDILHAIRKAILKTLPINPDYYLFIPKMFKDDPIIKLVTEQALKEKKYLLHKSRR